MSQNCRVLTHCNAGGLATGGIGTALGILKIAQKMGKEIQVYCDETRPLLQGARLSSWELWIEGLEVIVICDDMAAFLMKKGAVDLVIVGADRIALNGDTANTVSYTHLDVYKRQVLRYATWLVKGIWGKRVEIDNLIRMHITGWRPERMVTVDLEAIRLALYAVSYTHLDVYKRQVQVSWAAKGEDIDLLSLIDKLRKRPIFWAIIVSIVVGISQLGIKGLGLCVLFGLIGWVVAEAIISGKLSNLISHFMDRRH